MPHYIHSAMLSRRKKLRIDDFAFSYPPANSPSLIDQLTCLRRLFYLEVDHWKCPPRKYCLQSAFWPFSLFRRRKETEDPKIQALKSQLRNLELRSKVTEKSAADMRNDVDYVKRMCRQVYVSEQWRKKYLEMLRHNYQREKSEIEGQFQDLWLRFKSLKSHLEEDTISAEPENNDMEVSEDSTEKLKEDAQRFNEEDQHISDSFDLPDGPVEYSPDVHFKYVRQIEDKFGFKFEDNYHALVWQALQWKGGSSLSG